MKRLDANEYTKRSIRINKITMNLIFKTKIVHDIQKPDGGENIEEETSVNDFKCSSYIEFNYSL